MDQPRAQRRSQFKRNTARAFRANPTEAEQILWNRLRRKQLGVRFRRQHPMGPYIVDFFCPAARLVVELDGSQHGFETAIAPDERRTRWLEERGCEVLRIWNREFFTDIDMVMERIEHALRERVSPLPELLRNSTLPQGEGGL
jgi:very-short-patch-repair endonuclease